MASSKQTLGQLYQFYVLGINTPAGSVTTDMYNNAVNYFTQAFGVRITDRRDMDSLHYSYFNPGASLAQAVTDYQKWPQHDDMSTASVQRAALLATLWPYNNKLGSWTQDAVDSLPYVAPIPNIVYGGPTTPAPAPAPATGVSSTPYTVAVNPAAASLLPASAVPASLNTGLPVDPTTGQPAVPAPAATNPFLSMLIAYWWIPAGIVGIGLLVLLVRKKK